MSKKLEWDAIKLPIGQLVGFEDNPRQITESKFKSLKKSLDNLGIFRPMVLDHDQKTILAGNQRTKAILEKFPADHMVVCMVPNRKLTRKEVEAVVMQDNSHYGEFDFDILADRFDIEALKELDLDIAFPDIDIDVCDPQCDEDDVPEVQDEPVTKRGDVWILGKHRVACGDSTMIDDVDKLMNGEKADMVFTDPPYGDNHAAMELTPKSERKGTHDIKKRSLKIKNDSDISFLSDVAVNFKMYLKKDFAAFVFFKWSKWEMIKEYFTPFGSPKTVCVWDRASQGASTFRINPVHEFCFYWGTLGDKKEKGNLRNVWRCRKEVENKQLHPTVKPIDIIEMPIRMCCEKKGLVIDLFLGSGSTLIACEKTNRKCYGLEIDPKYNDVICQRWMNFTGRKDCILESTGQTFEEVKNERL